MKLDLIKRLRTVDDLCKLNSLLDSYVDEHRVNKDTLLELDYPSLPNLHYVLSTSFNGSIHTNWFTYNVDGFYGLAYASCGSSNIITLTECKYISFQCIHNNLWLGKCTDLSYDIILNGNAVLSGVFYYDILDLTSYLSFLQLDDRDNRYLICIRNDDLNKGIFLPSSLSSFEDWFKSNVAKLGYQGYLDDVSISELISFYYEIQDCIFCNGNFKPIWVSCK